MLCVTDASCILPLLCVQELTTDCMSQTLLMFYHCCVYRSYQQAVCLRRFLYFTIAVCTGANNRLYVSDVSYVLPLLCVQELTTNCMSQTLLVFYHCCLYWSYQHAVCHRRFLYSAIAVCTGANNRLYVSDASYVLPLLCVQ